jgi:hypothetical protein
MRALWASQSPGVEIRSANIPDRPAIRREFGVRLLHSHRKIVRGAGGYVLKVIAVDQLGVGVTPLTAALRVMTISRACTR